MAVVTGIPADSLVRPSSPAPHSVPRNLNLQPKNKVVTGTKNGMGYIADPAKRHLSPSGTKVTKIMDPIRPNHGCADNYRWRPDHNRDDDRDQLDRD